MANAHKKATFSVYIQKYYVSRIAILAPPPPLFFLISCFSKQNSNSNPVNEMTKITPLPREFTVEATFRDRKWWKPTCRAHTSWHVVCRASTPWQVACHVPVALSQTGSAVGWLLWSGIATRGFRGDFARYGCHFYHFIHGECELDVLFHFENMSF